MSKAGRVPIRHAEIRVGAPLPWSVYDENGTLLLTVGHVPASESQVASLIARGIYRTEAGGGAEPPSRPSTVTAKPATPPVSISATDPIQFDDLSLKPGELSQLHPALEVAGDFRPSVLLGYLKHQTIILTNPIVGGKLVPIKEGAPYNVKAFSGTNLFSFRTKVVKAYAQPYAHLHLEYPKLVHATKIRKSLRSVVNLPALLRNLDTQAETEVMIKDLSAGGAKLVLPGDVGQKEAKYALSFKIKLAEDLESEVTAPVVAKTLELQTIKGIDTHVMGAQFQDVEKEARLLILALVYRQHIGKD